MIPEGNPADKWGCVGLCLTTAWMVSSGFSAEDPRHYGLHPSMWLLSLWLLVQILHPCWLRAYFASLKLFRKQAGSQLRR